MTDGAPKGGAQAPSRASAVGIAFEYIRRALRAEGPSEVAGLWERAADLPADCCASVRAVTLLQLEYLAERVAEGERELREARERMRFGARGDGGAERGELVAIVEQLEVGGDLKARPAREGGES